MNHPQPTVYDGPALSLSREQWQLIADALLFAEVALGERSERLTVVAARETDKARMRVAMDAADRQFCRACDARDLSEAISVELRKAIK